MDAQATRRGENEKRLAEWAVLLDIDGTMVRPAVTGARPGVRALNRAGSQVIGRDGLADAIDFSGATDLSVAAQMLTAAGAAVTEEAVRAVLAAYARAFAAAVTAGEYRPLGDPAAFVRPLRELGARITVATGNVAAGARIKLRAAGLEHLVDWAVGGFGEHGVERRDIVQHAWRASGRPRAVVVGDTPRDVHGALEVGAVAVGVCTGGFSDAELRNAGAHLVIPALSAETADAVAALVRGRAT